MASPLGFFAILCSVLCAATATDIENKKAVIRRLSYCQGTKNLIGVFSNYRNRYNEKTKQNEFSLKVTVKEPVSNDLVIGFSFWKCDATGNPDGCEYVIRDHNVTEICEYMEVKGEMYSEFMGHFNPPLVCPIKPGVYNLRDFYITNDFLRFLPAGNAVWKVEFTGYDHGKIVSCVFMIIEIVPVYVKRQ